MKRAPLIGAGLASALLLTGCGLYNADLPGGADLGDHPYSVVVDFTDALDLVPQSGVKVNDVSVGKVTGIVLDPKNTYAKVTVELNGSVDLPANAVASISQTSLLGEKYVALSAPQSVPATGRLAAGAEIPVSRTTQGVEVETLLGALSLLLNGGGLGNLHEIYTELNAFQGDHSTEIRQFFEQVQSVITKINTNRGSITNALDQLSTLSQNLAGKQAQIKNLLTSFAPGIAELARQRTQIIGALNALNRLSSVTVSTLDASKDDIVSDFNSLAVVLKYLAAAGSALPASLQVLFTYPFTDAATAGIKGDYLNAWVTEHLTWTQPPPDSTSAAAQQAPAVGSRVVTDSSQPAGLLPPSSSGVPGLPSTLTVAPTGSSAAASGSASGSPSASRPSSSGSKSGSASGTGSSASGSPTGSTSSGRP